MDYYTNFNLEKLVQFLKANWTGPEIKFISSLEAPWTGTDHFFERLSGRCQSRGPRKQVCQWLEAPWTDTDHVVAVSPGGP